MNKTLMPALLVATIMVAGAFALMPVEQASTVHLTATTIAASIDAVNDVFIDASTGAVSISSGSEAADSVNGDISIDALLDVQIDGLSGVAISAGTEAAAAANGVMTLTAANAASVTSTASTVTVATTAAQDIVLDADVGATTGTVNIVGSGTASDILQLGNDTTPTKLQKTGANQLTITATDLVLSADVIGNAEVVGSNGANAPIAFDSGTGTSISAVTSSYTPAVSSQALVLCTWEGTTTTAAIVAGILTLTTSGNGTIVGGAAHNIDESVATNDFAQGTDVWKVHSITDATTFTCTLSGAGVADADIDNISIISMMVPE